MRAVILGLVVFALGLATAALVASPRAGAHGVDGTLSGSVGPGFSISLSASSVAAGSYTINISDQSSIHNFHLSGPGVNKATSISGTGSTSWSVTLQAGTYTYQCDAHASTMNGSLTVTGSSTTTTQRTTTEHTTTEHTTSQATTTEAAATTTAVTTTAPAPTTTVASTQTAATTTQSAPPPAKPLKAHVSAAHATTKSVTVSVASNERGHAVAELFSGSHRVARATGTVPGKLVLHPAKPLAAGRYLVKLRVTAGGKTTKSTRTVTVA